MTKKQNKRIRQAVGLVTVAMAAHANATTYIWNNTAGGNWSVGTNWTPNTVVSDPTTTLDFSQLNASYTTTDDIGTAASPFVLNRLIVGNTGTPIIAGGYLNFSGANETIQKLTGGGSPILNSSTTISFGSTLTLAGVSSQAMTFSNKFTGTGGIVINGLSAVLNTNSSDYSGGTTLAAGELVVYGDATTIAGGAISNGPVGTGTLTINGGNIRTNSGNARVIYNAVSVGGNFSFGGSTNTLTLAGLVTLNGSAVNRGIALNSSTKNLVIAGAIGDGGNANGLSITGTGQLNFGGGAADTAANTYTGVTALNSSTATILLDKANGTNAVAGNINFQTGSLLWNRANQIADTATITVAGGALAFTADEQIANLVENTGSVVVNGNINVTVASLLSISNGTALATGGTLTVGGLSISPPNTSSSIYDVIATNSGTLGTPSNTPGTLKLAGNVTVAASTSAYATRIKQGGPGGYLDLNGAQRTFDIGSSPNATENLIISAFVIDGTAGTSAGFKKIGAGTLALTNDADVSVSGASSVDAGRLVVYNYYAAPTSGLSATGSGKLTINSLGTLGGNGKVGTVTVNGVVDPSLPSSGSVGGTPNTTTPRLSANSMVFADGSTLHLDGLGGTSDSLAVNGLLDLSSTTDTLQLVGSAPSSNTTLASYGSITGTFNTVTFNGAALPSYESISYTSTTGAGQIVLVVPEPASMSVWAIAGASSLCMRRRARRNSKPKNATL